MEIVIHETKCYMLNEHFPASNIMRETNF